MTGFQTLVGEIVSGVVALSLVGASVVLLWAGKQATGFTEVVPIIVAFYFGGRVSTSAATNAIQAANGTLAKKE